MKISSNIRSLRLKNKLSQERLGALLNVSGQAVSKWEQGITSPDISLLPSLAQCFGVTIDSLFEGMNERRYPGYGSDRNEMVALYCNSDGTEEDFSRAEASIGKVILENKATTEDYVNYGLLYHVRTRRDADMALHYYRLAIEKGNDKRDLQWMSAHQAITNLLHYLGRIDEAVSEHQYWCEMEPNCAWAHVSYAYALQNAGRLEDAEVETQKALELDADDINALDVAGTICRLRGKYDEAISYWDREFACDPTQLSCLFEKASMLESVNRLDEAISQYGKILEQLEKLGYNMELEGAYLRQKIEELCNRGKDFAF